MRLRWIPLLSLAPLLLLGAAGAPPLPASPWPASVAAELRARARGQDLVVYFALPGRELSDKMERQSLHEAGVLAALAAAGFASARIDAFADQGAYGEWVGGGEGMGLAVLDGDLQVWAARPGPQDPPELAAWLQLCARRREAVRAARADVAAADAAAVPARSLALGSLLLELGCRKGTATLLRAAAEAGLPSARPRLARLFALDGDVASARDWLPAVVEDGETRVAEGYVLYKERRHQEAVAVLAAALQQELGDERPRAQLFYGKALHEAGRDPEARRVLEDLVAAAAGTTYAGAALHALQHVTNPDHGHPH